MANTTPHAGADYDLGIIKTIPYYQYFHPEIVELVAACQPRCQAWLDAGCGTGSLVETAIARFPGTQYYLCDPSEEMLAEARKKVERFLQCHFVACPSEKLDQVPDLPEFDVVTAVQSHHYSKPEGRRKSVENCHRLLRKGGLFVTFENIRPESEDGIRIGLDRWIAYQRRQGKSEQELAAHRARFGKSFFPITVLEHLELLKQTGFQTAELFWYSHLQAGFYAIK